MHQTSTYVTAISISISYLCSRRLSIPVKYSFSSLLAGTSAPEDLNLLIVLVKPNETAAGFLSSCSSSAKTLSPLDAISAGKTQCTMGNKPRPHPVKQEVVFLSFFFNLTKASVGLLAK